MKHSLETHIDLTHARYSVLVTLLFLLAACGGQQAADTVIIPTATTQPSAMTMLIPPDADAEEADLTAVEDEIFKRSAVKIDLQKMARYADALKAVCNTRNGFTAAWVDGLTYAVVTAQNCGFPSLQLVNTDATPPTSERAATTPTADTESLQATPEITAPTTNGLAGLPGVIVVNTDLGTTEMSVILSRTYCRLSETDFYSWLLPTLMFESVNIDLTDPTQVKLVNYDDNDALLDAVASGECAMTGVSQEVVDDGLPDGVGVAQTSVEFPFGVLVYPGEIDGGVRGTVTQTLLDIANDPETSDLLTPLFDDKTLLPATAADFERLEAFLATTGLDFAGLGQ